jgi:hypothetical protein
MLDELRPLRSVEKALEELSAAERAGVFSATRLDTRVLRAGRAGSAVVRLLYRAGAIAAGVGLALLAWNSGRPPGISPTTPGGLLASAAPCNGTFFGCVTGPRSSLGTPCHDFDYDADGDVDMADFRTYQLECEGITR